MNYIALLCTTLQNSAKHHTLKQMKATIEGHQSQPKAKLGQPKNIRIDQPTEERLNRLAASRGISVSVLIRDAVHARLHRWETEGVSLVELH